MEDAELAAKHGVEAIILVSLHWLSAVTALTPNSSVESRRTTAELVSDALSICDSRIKLISLC